MKKFNLKTLFFILTLGALWGILEATLGTFLHFTGVAKTFLSSSIIMVPIAYAILSIGYKYTSKLRSIFLIGLVAGTIKLTAFLVPGIAPNFIINPAVSIVLESCAFGLAVYFVKPQNILSYKGIAVVLLSSIVFRLSFTLYQLATVVPFGSASFDFVNGVLSFNEAGFIKFNITQNAIACAYTLGLGCVAAGASALIAKKNVKFRFDVIQRIVTNPLTACLMVGVAVTLTVVL